jgi:orotidine-5'-phosphate decarboxylase
MSRDFRQLLEKKWDEGKFLCVGIDPDFDKIPQAVRLPGMRETLVAFNRSIIDATRDLVCAFKPNSAFFETYGDEGWKALRETIQYILDTAPEVPIILDSKRADIGNTNEQYAKSVFDYLRADAITVHPYMGGESLKEFFARKEKGIFVMCKTSNPGADEFEDLDAGGQPLYLHVAHSFAEKWNGNGNCGLVVGATYPADIERVRKAVPEMLLLIPGIGAQGGDLETSVANAKDAHGRGFIINASRTIIFASDGRDFARAARSSAQQLDSAIRKAL